MYNYQTFLRDNRLHQKFDQIRKNYLDTNHSRQKKMPSMIQSHKKRIEGFIISMVQKPISVQQYRNKMFEHRSFDKKKNLAHNAFYTNHHLQKTRIKEITEQNSVLDQVPFENVSKHKYRNFQWTPDTKPLRYTPMTSVLRVKQKLDYEPLNYVSSCRNKNIQQSMKNCYKNGNTKGLMKLASKALLPNLHQKTHFHSIKTIYSQSPCGFLKNNSEQKENIDRNTYEQDNQFQSKKQQQKIQNDFMNRKENSRQALVRCGLLGNLCQKKMYATTGSLKRKS